MTSPVDTTVKALWSSMSGATAGSNAIGGLIPVLDAALVDGWGLLTATSVTVSGGVCTMSFPTTPAAEVGTVILAAGATTKTGINGEQRVTGKTTNTLSFATAESNGSVSGTVTMKVAPLGWTKLFAGSNKAVYKPSDPAATGNVLRVDDTATTNARVVGYESMSDVDNGSGPFPTSAQLAGGMYWMKGNAWAVVGDGRAFYLFMGAGTGGQLSVEFFGDIVSDKPGDVYACAIFGARSNQTGGVNNTECLSYLSTDKAQHGYLPRSHTAVSGSVIAGKYSVPWPSTSANYSGSGPSDHPYPNGADNSLRPSVLQVHAANTVRGSFPGFYGLFQSGVNASFSNLDTIAGAGDLVGRTLRMFRTGSPSGSSQLGTVACDVTGPWAR